MSGELTTDLAWYPEAWSRGLRQVLGSDVEVTIHAAESGENEAGETAETDPCWLRLEASGDITGSHALSLGRGAIRDLARLVGRNDPQAGDAAVLDDPLKVLATAVATNISDETARSVRFAAAESQAPDWEVAATLAWSIDPENGPSMVLGLALSHGALDSVRSASESGSSDVEGPALVDITVDMLRDVRIPAVLRVGGREILLSEVLTFAGGEPLGVDPPFGTLGELAVGEEVIARGEIVLVDGCYGLRVSEVLGQDARIAMVRDGDVG